jgi:hypothetical protein
MSNFFTTDVPIVPVDEYKQYPDLVSAVEKATDPSGNCAPNIKDDTGELTAAQEKSLQETMGMLGISTCESTQAGFKAEYQGKVPFVNVGGSVAGNVQTQSGCEQVNVISNIVSQCTQQLSCMLNEVQANSTTNIKEFQEIILDVGDVSNSNITLGNLSETDVKLVNIAQSSVQSAIGATMTQGVQSAIDQSLALNAGAHSDASSQKNMTQLLQNLKSVASNTTINKSVATTSANICKDQKIKLYAGNITGTTIDIQNVSKINLISENYVYNALDQLFKTEQVQTALNEIVQTSTATKKGVLDGMNLGGFSTGEIIASIVAFIVIGVVLYFIGKMYFSGGKKNSKRQRQQQRQQRRQ